jgi:tetratricopeptide (TPR) repeat protein
MRTVFAAILSLAAFAQTKTPDLCAPPPGGAAPALPAKLMSGQGKIHFPITTANPQAQAFFNQGVAQMHSFWATEAERSFRQAAALDPGAAMPQWGIAMVASGDYRPRFQLQDGRQRRTGTLEGAPARALEAARKAGELGKNATPLERLYIDAIRARRDADAKDPDEAYIRGLRAVIAAHPDEVEARSYLALHLMAGFTLPEKEPRPGSMEAVEILRALLAKAPDHPGVHHYVIHAWEGSRFAKEAWTSCRRYPELVNNIPHALHMPGHIWAQTGKWDEAEKSFAAAAENELGYIRGDQLYETGHHGHNVHFLASAHAFHGNYDEAVKAARHLLEFKENPRQAAQVDNFRTAYRQGWFALFRTLVQFEKWDEILDGGSLPVYDKPREQAWRQYAIGLAHAARGNAAAAKDAARAMDRALTDLKAKAGNELSPHLKVARDELDGHIAVAEGKLDRAVELLQAASAQERALRYNEPPQYPRPVLEALGRIALRHGRPALAERAFRGALEQFPESSHALAGLNAIAIPAGGR